MIAQKNPYVMAMLATVAPTPLIIFCASMVDVSFISAPT